MTGILDSITGALDKWWQTNKVYDARGRQIGYYTSVPNLCRGVIQLYAGEIAGDPKSWQVDGPFGVPMPALTRCIADKAVTPGDASAVGTAADSAAQDRSSIPQLIPSLPLPNFSLPNVDGMSRLGTYALYGATALLLLTVLRRRA